MGDCAGVSGLGAAGVVYKAARLLDGPAMFLDNPTGLLHKATGLLEKPAGSLDKQAGLFYDAGVLLLRARLQVARVHALPADIGGGRRSVTARHHKGSFALSRPSGAPQGGLRSCQCPSNSSCGLA